MNAKLAPMIYGTELLKTGLSVSASSFLVGGSSARQEGKNKL
jgi:hypothetical protein